MNINDKEGEGCNVLLAANEQPHTVTHHTADGIYIMEIVMKAC